MNKDALAKANKKPRTYHFDDPVKCSRHSNGRLVMNDNKYFTKVAEYAIDVDIRYGEKYRILFTHETTLPIHLERILLDPRVEKAEIVINL